MTNPFQQTEELWLLSFSTQYKNINSFEELFDEKALAISSHEISSTTVDAMPDDQWMIEMYLSARPHQNIIPKGLYDLIDSDSIKITKVESKDWTDRALSTLGEIKTEKFHIIRSRDALLSGLIPIILNLTRAFGTGEHATTIGCLEALELHAGKKVHKVLDIGTGTGILAIAAKKLWPGAEVWATDIDAVAIEVAKEHANTNEVELKFEVMDGVASLGVRQKYDIILANILARPLMEMAENISSLVAASGVVILSGFLENQMDDILEAYEKYYLLRLKHFNKNNWITLILAK